MFTNIEKFAEDSITLKEARKNVEKMPSIKKIGLYVVLCVILLIAMSVVGIIFGVSDEMNTHDYLITLFSFIVVPIVVYLFATKIEKRSWRSIGFSKSDAVSSTLKGLLIGFSMFLAVVVIGFALGQFTFDGFDLS